jgi:potassium efflux system protein
MTISRLRLMISLFCALFCAAMPCAHAQTQPPTQSPASAVTDAPVEKITEVYLDINDEIEALKNQKVGNDIWIARLNDMTQLAAAHQELHDELDRMREQYEIQKSLSSWGAKKITDLSHVAKKIFDGLDQLRADYHKTLGEADDAIESVRVRKATLRQLYAQSIKDGILTSDHESLTAALKMGDELVANLREARANYTKFYAEQSPLRQAIADFQKEILSDQEELRQSLFKKTSAAIYQGDFFREFNASLWQEFVLSFRSNLSLDEEKWITVRGFYFEMLVVFLALWIVFAKLFVVLGYGEASGTGKRLWDESVLASAGVVLTLISIAGFEMPLLATIIFWLLVALVAAVAVRRLETGVSRARFAVMLSLVYPLFRIFSAMGLPHAVYRLILLAGSVTVAAYSVYRWRRLRLKAERLFSAELMYQMAALLFLIIGVSSLIGYILLADFLFNCSLEVLFVIWIARYLYPVLAGFVSHAGDFLFARRFHWVRGRKLVGKGALKTVLLIFTVGAVLVDLIALWHNQSFSETLQVAFNYNLGSETQAIRPLSLLIGVLAFYVVNLFVALLCGFLESEIYDRKNIGYGTGQSFNRLIQYLGWFIGSLLAIHFFGFRLEQFALIASALSVGIGFGLQNIVNNFVSGLILLFERPIKVGDLIDMSNGQSGTIEKVGLRSTVVRGSSKAQYIIPNSYFVTETVSNLTFSDSDYRVILPILVAFDTDTDLLKAELAKICDAKAQVLKEPAPRVQFVGFGENGINFELWVWIQNVQDRGDIASDLFFVINSRFREIGIRVPYPQRDVHVSTEGNTTKGDDKP